MTETNTSTYAEEQLLALALFALCPLLLKSNTLLGAMFIGLVALSVLLLVSLSVSLVRHFIPHRNSWLFILIISSTWVTAVDLFLQANFYAARLDMGIYVSVIAVNSVLLVMQEQIALREGAHSTVYRVGKYGLAMLAILLCLGTVRELLGTGGLFGDAHLYSSYPITAHLRPWQFADGGAILFSKAAGAFLCLGLLIAACRYVRGKRTTTV